jgi:hypothetical protein
MQTLVVSNMNQSSNGLRYLLFAILLVLSACSLINPGEKPTSQPEAIAIESHVSYVVPDMREVVEYAEVIVIAKVEPTGITYNWHEAAPDNGNSFIYYQRNIVYRVNVQRYLKGAGEMVLYVGFRDGDLLIAWDQEDLEAKLAKDGPARQPLEEDKLYLLLMTKHSFNYRPPEIDVDIFYEGAPVFNAFEILESGETKAILSYIFWGSSLDPRWTLDDFIRYIESPELIPTPTPWPTQEPVESYPIPINTVVPYPFPLGTPFPYDTYPRP